MENFGNFSIAPVNISTNVTNPTCTQNGATVNITGVGRHTTIIVSLFNTWIIL